MSRVPSWQGDGRPSDDVVEGSVGSSVEEEKGRQIPCPVCGFPIGAVRGSKAAICGNCGFKDGCC